MTTTPNRRLHARKVLRTAATVQLAGAPPRDVRTWDLGLDGMSLVSPKPIGPGNKCTVTLDLVHGGATTRLSVTAKSVYCSLLGPDGFKVGLVFVDLNPDSERALREFVQ